MAPGTDTNAVSVVRTTSTDGSRGNEKTVKNVPRRATKTDPLPLLWGGAVDLSPFRYVTAANQRGNTPSAHCGARSQVALTRRRLTSTPTRV